MAFTVKDDAILNLNNDVTATTLTVGEGVSGKLNVGGNSPTLTGALTTAAGATFKTTITGAAANAAGSLTVSGASTIDNSLAVFVETGAVSLVDGTSYKIIDSASGSTGTIANISDDNLSFDFMTDLTNGDLTITVDAITDLVVLDGETLVSATDANLTSITVGEGVSGIINQTGGTVTMSTLTLNAGGTLTQSDTGIFNATDVTLGAGATIQGTGALTVSGILNLMAGGSISSTSILSGGSVKVGSNSSSATGSFNLAAGATFYTTVNSGETNDAGSLVVNGDANVSADAIVMVEVSENAVVGTDTSYVIIDATGGDINAPTMVIDDNDDLTFRASVDGTNLLITASLGNELEALIDELSDELDTLSATAEAVLTPLAALVDADPELAAALAAVTTVAEFEEVLSSLAPDVSAAVQTATQTAGRSAVVTILNRLTALRTGFGGITGLAAGDQFSDVTSWVQAFGSTADQNDRGGIAGFDIDSRGITFGIDSAVTSNLRLGGAFSYSSTDVDTKGFNNNTDIDTYQGTLYGSLNHPGWYLDGSLSYAWSNSEGRRNIAFGALNRTALADYDSNQFIAQATYGRDIRLDNDIIINPYVGLEYVNLDTEDYTETGAGTLNLAVASADTSALKSTVGVSIRKAFESGEDYTIMPEAHIGWRYDFLDEAQTNSSNFTGGGTAFNTQGLNPADSSFNIGGALSVYSSGNTEFQMKYDFETRSDYDAHAGFLVFRYKF
ncbi:MAG: autotransporter domain-containing protein [Gammaproteobacteria bacterium]|jgi:outer membrane autotransporter protein|nr:autotransporter domain-containing protein [Gammaproteobacteria bacterium]